MSIHSRLSQLSYGNEQRLAVLKARKARSKSRSRRLICPVCSEDEYSDRDAADVCDDCVATMWEARKIVDGYYKAAKKTNLVPVATSNRSHDLPYPHLASDGGRVGIPVDAVFARTTDSEFYPVENSDRTLQILYLELMEAFAEALPVDDKSKQEAISLLDGGTLGWDRDQHVHARLPKGAIKSLRDLWAFVRWQSHASFQRGFDAGRDLLSQMNLGMLTAESFMLEIEEQTKRRQEEMTKIGTPKEINEDDPFHATPYRRRARPRRRA